MLNETTWSLWVRCCLVACVLIIAAKAPAQIVFNEIMSSNSQIAPDFAGDFPDWIELYNTSAEPVDLSDYHIAHGDLDETWSLPSLQMEPNGFLLIYASGKDGLFAGEVHSDFKINQEGEALALFKNTDTEIERIALPFFPENTSYGKLEDGSTTWAEFLSPTPEATNETAIGIHISHFSGMYEQGLNLECSTNSTLDIRYTVDGSEPTFGSLIWNGPLSLTAGPTDPVDISFIPTTPIEEENWVLDMYRWKSPEVTPQCHVLRFALFADDVKISRDHSRSFFVGTEAVNRHAYPVVSMLTNPDRLFDHNTGIYVPGQRFVENGFNHWAEGNYHNKGIEWERGIHLSMLNQSQLLFETDAGARMRGYGSACMPQKSFNIFFRKEYGLNRIETPIFRSHDYPAKRLVLRNSGTDFLYTHFRDALLQELIGDMDIELQAFEPGVLYINGEYWGIYNLREKYDRHFFEQKWGIEEDELEYLRVCGTEENGSNDAYEELVNFVKQEDMTDMENYALVSEKLDLNNFVDYQIAQVFFANQDWPCNNYKIWRNAATQSKWRYMIYDLDVSTNIDNDSFTFEPSMIQATVEGDSWPTCACANPFFRELLKNESFRDLFIDRFIYHLEHTFHPDRFGQLIDKYKNIYEPEIDLHIARWGYPAGRGKWDESIDRLRDFADQRGCFLQSHIPDFFGLEDINYRCQYQVASDLELLALPNPNTGLFRLYNNSPEAITGVLQLVNMTGQVVYERKEVIIQPGLSLRLNTQNLTQGYYAAYITDGERVTTTRILIAE